MRTRLSICAKKVRYSSEDEAVAAAVRADLPLRPYRCDRCRKYHLTSRTKAKRVPRAMLQNRAGREAPDQPGHD